MYDNVLFNWNVITNLEDVFIYVVDYKHATNIEDIGYKNILQRLKLARNKHLNQADF